MDIRNASVAAALVAVCGSIASAQSIEWLNAVDGDWNTASNWVGGNVPNTTTEIPVLGLSGMYTVTSSSNKTFGGLMITNPDAVLHAGTFAHSCYGDVMNEGLISVNYGLSIFNSSLIFESTATISGSGMIRLNADSNTDDAQINANSGTITHANGHTIAGSGRLTGAMNNMGDIIADDPTGQGLLLNGVITQSGGGRIGADEGTIILGNGSITTGGLFSTINGGVINVPSNLAQIGDVNNTGDITINGGGDFLGLISSIENNGNISINDNLNIFNAHLRFDANATINGTGTIDLASPSGDQADAQIIASSPFVGTIGAGQTVQGSGRIDGLSGGIIVNNGTVIANDPDFPLGISGRHNPGSGEYRAEGDGLLGLNNGSILTGVTFDTSGNGSVDVIGNTANASSITNNGQMGIWGNGYFLTLSGPLTNNGTITINNNLNIFNAHLRFDTNTDINGTGMIVMNVPSGDRADAQIYTVPGITGTIGSGQTVMGSGWIDGRDGGSIIVNGNIIGTSPTDALFIDGIIDASGGGVFRGDNGVLALDAGLVLTGGTFESVGTGEVNKTGNGTATISGVTNNGNMGIRGSGGFIDLSGNLTNNGVCTLNSDLNIFNAHLTASSNVTIDGNGTVRLQSAGELADAQMFTTDVVNMTIGANQTVAGSGQFDGRSGGTIINNGTVNGDDPAFELRMLGNHSGSGVYRSDNGTLGLGSALVMDGGTFDSSGTGMVAKTNNGIATVSNMTNDGQLNIWGSGGFIDLASDLTNNGEIWINSNSNIFNAHLRFTDSYEINGTGTIRMTTNGSGGDAQIIVSDPATATLGSGQTLIGDGLLVGNMNVDGTIDPDGPSRAFTADNISLSSSSQMIVDLGGLNPGEFDRVVLSGSDVMEIDGTLTVNIDSGYAPLFGDTWDIISGGTNSGTFSEVITGTTPIGQVYRAIYAADRVFVILTCDADLSGDGVIDFFDVSTFLNFFGAQDVRGDLNGDGNFDFFDVSTFLQLFSQGCNP